VTKTLYLFLIFPMNVTYPIHHTFLL
jgi:hypothetical protein